jgi:GNAT superfamily N-acetyltransferase
MMTAQEDRASSFESSEEIVLRPMKERDLPEVMELLRVSLGERPFERDEAFWRWKHEENPFGPSAAIVAEASGRIVGLRAFLRWKWRTGAAIVDAVRAVDTATHPDWRRKGIFRKLTLQLVAQVAAEGSSFVFNTPNRSSRAGYLQMGWRDVRRVPVVAKVLRPMELALGFLRSTNGHRDAARAVVDAPPVSELLRQPFLEELLARSFQGEPRLHTPRTIEYLRWRYDRIPGVEYNSLWDSAGESSAAVVMRARSRGRLREVALTEIFATPDQDGERLASSLVRRVAPASNAHYLVASAAPRSVEAAALRKAGLRTVPFSGPYFTVRTLRPGTLDATEWRNWRPSVGDLEMF